MYQRIVCFKFTPDASPEAIQAHMDGFKALKAAIPQILSYSGGLVTGGDQGAPADYDSMHYATYASLEDIDIYFNHEAHQQYIQDHKAIWDKVLVLNAEINE